MKHRLETYGLEGELQLTGHVVADEGDADVDQIVEPAGHHGFAGVGDDANELRLEELVAVEEDIVTEPATRSCDQTGTKVGEGELERFHIIASNLGLLLGGQQLLSGGLHLKRTEVDEPEGANRGNGKGDTVRPLRGHLRIGWVA